MTAIAPRIASLATEPARAPLPAAQIVMPAEDRVADAPKSPWRAPLFYLAFLASALLLVAVAVILLWRVVTGTRMT